MNNLTHRDPNRAALFSNNQNKQSNPPQPFTSHRNLPSYGRSYGSSSLYGHPSNSNLSSSLSSSHRTAEELESQNDEAIEGLSAKVRLLKEITVNIGTEVKDSSKLISGMNDRFSEAKGFLSGTFKKMNRMSQRQTGRWWYWLLFLIVVFWIFVFTWLWRH